MEAPALAPRSDDPISAAKAAALGGTAKYDRSGSRRPITLRPPPKPPPFGDWLRVGEPRGLPVRPPPPRTPPPPPPCDASSYRPPTPLCPAVTTFAVGGLLGVSALDSVCLPYTEDGEAPNGASIAAGEDGDSCEDCAIVVAVAVPSSNSF